MSRPSATSGRSTHYTIVLSLLPLLAICVLCNALLFMPAIIETPLGLTLSVAAAVVPAVFYSSLVILLDRYEREPAWILLGTFFWGAVVATAISAGFNAIFELVLGIIVDQESAAVLTASITAPIVEETSKGAALLLLYLLLPTKFDDVLDGIVYGSLIGIGFAMTENVYYFVREYSQYGILGFSMAFYLRVVVVGLAHAAYTATTGAGFGYARESQWQALKVIVPLAAWALAVLQHFAWNFVAASLIASRLINALGPFTGLLVAAPLMGLVFLGPPLLALLALVVLTWRRQARIITEQLRTEVATGIITPAEFARLSSKRRRLLVEWQVLIYQGIRNWRLQARLHRAATELAFHKWHVARGDAPLTTWDSGLDDECRTRIGELRRQLAWHDPPQRRP